MEEDPLPNSDVPAWDVFTAVRAVQSPGLLQHPCVAQSPASILKDIPPLTNAKVLAAHLGRVSVA